MALPNLYMAFALARLRGYDLELAGAGMPPALIYRAAEVVQEVGSRDPQRITRHFEETIRTWGGDKPIDDDITFLVLKIRDDSKIPPM